MNARDKAKKLISKTGIKDIDEVLRTIDEIVPPDAKVEMDCKEGENKSIICNFSFTFPNDKLKK
ncbi:hypothetical protein ACA758_04465 [Mycoplasmopsis agassizii]|uniref:hypothetical protein n=1 Tax=Mycoplasmopsis agassizii TaxID=33922 RepID=UPI003528364F